MHIVATTSTKKFMFSSPVPQRFWFFRGSLPQLEGGTSGGYLNDPQHTTFSGERRARKDAQTLEQLSNVQCLFLLGEMGMGKTEELRSHVANLRAASSSEQILEFDLSCRSEIQLHNKVFESDILSAWLNGNYPLYLFLDAYDEGLLGIPHLGKLLQTEMRDWPVERLFLRMTCRPAQWPSSLEELFRRLWQNESSKEQEDEADKTKQPKKVQTYHLAPLRQMDVRHLAEHHEEWKVEKPDDFMSAVAKRNIQVFAAKPLTLKFLLQQFRAGNILPNTRAELWEKGCLELCKERNPNRLDSGEASRFEATELLATATRIAGVTLFSKRNALYLGPYADEAGEEEISPFELVGGEEPLDALGDEKSVEVNKEIAFEAAKTGLFAGIGTGAQRVAWQHRGYEEFLAARYLVVRAVPLPRLISLLCHEGRKVFPPVREVAATLATLHPQFFDHLLAHDLDTVLDSDVAAQEDKERERLVETIILSLSAEELRAQDLFRRTRALHHSTLGKQILPLLRDKGQTLNTRLGAVFLAYGCFQDEDTAGLETEVEDELARIALDDDEAEELRAYAAIALLHAGSEAAKKQLLPLARSMDGVAEISGESIKVSRDLKGVALEATWPLHLSATELFNALESPSEAGHSTYESFLSFHLVKSLAPTDFPTALEWITRQDRAAQSSYYLRKLMEEIIVQAWKHMEVEGVADALAAVVMLRAQEHDEVAGVDVVKEDGTPI